jgi:cytochrome c551/c552
MSNLTKEITMNCRSVTTIIVAGLSLALGCGGALAQDAKQGEAKAQQGNCLMCHAVDGQKIGPSYRDVAKQYGSGDKIVAAVKADKNHQTQLKAVSDDDLKLIANWIAGL